MGQKHIYLPHEQTAIYDSKVKLFLKQGISHQLGRDAVVRFECENSAIFYEKYSTSLSTIVLVVLTTANFGGFSNLCRYYTGSQAGKSTGYRPTLKPLLVAPQLAHYAFTTLQFGCCLVRSLSYVKITLPQRILDT